MATQERKGFLFMELSDDFAHGIWDKEWRPIWREYKAGESTERIFIGEHTLVCEVPDNFDPRAKQIAALEAQKREITAEFQAAVTEINARISKLQAIEYVAA
jgi:hypothetical protein